MFQNGETEGWVPLIAAKDENNLILIAKEMFRFDDVGIKFVALENGASISILAELNGIQPMIWGSIEPLRLRRASQSSLGTGKSQLVMLSW